MLKRLPIGKDDFKEIIEDDFYYADKTEIIDKLLKDGNYISLFPRPRRFGKSLFISMLDNFFNIEYKDTNKHLFEGLNIEMSEFYSELSSKPVIKLDFKSLKQDSYEEIYESFKEMIINLYTKFEYVLNRLSEGEQDIFNSIKKGVATSARYKNSINYLSEYLYKYYNIKPIILIDEYDVPIERGYINNFYDDVVNLIRNVLSNALKGNSNISFAVMTGVLRVSKESLFSDLNNVEVYTINNEFYNDCFGFTESETKRLLENYDLELNDEVKNMYDGYNFCGAEIYNPWSILNYAKYKKLDKYWVNTSGNELIYEVVKNCNSDIKVKIEKLLLGDKIEFIYNDKTTYQDYSNLNDGNSIFNLLLASGYLTIYTSFDEYNNKITYVKLPNREVIGLFNNILNKILNDMYEIDLSKVRDFFNGVLNNNKIVLESVINKMLSKFSFYDLNEQGYHVYIMTLFSFFINDNNFIIYSNRESGNGRFDIMIKDKKFKKGIIMEFKVTKDDLENAALKGLKQIEEKEYYMDLINEGYSTIYKYVIVFARKKCIVR